MKKLLLSALCLAGVASMASAADTTLDVNNATNFQGTLVDERPAGTNGDKDNGQAKHYQPINSLEINGYSFAFTKGGSTTDPAYYWSMSTAKDQQQTIRVYGGKDGADGNTMTITAPEGVTFGKITFTCKSGTKDATVNASVGAVSGVTTSAMVWQNTTAVNTVTLAFTGKTQILKMVVSSEGGEVNPPVEPTGVTFTKATTVETGTYVFAVNEEGTLKLARPYIGTQAYGRMNLTEATLESDNIITEEANAFELTVADGKVTIKNDGRFYGMDDSHFTSFQFYTEVNDGCYYTYEFVDGAVKLSNTLNPTCFVCQSKGNQGTWYSNVAPAKEPAEFNLPMLYKKSTSGVEAVEANVDANAPVVYYNLQGQRVANPENGLYIRVQGNKVEKVAIR